MFVREDPLTINLGQLLNFVDLWVVQDDSCSGPINGEHSIDLGVQLFPNQLVLIMRPDGEDTSHREVGINN